MDDKNDPVVRPVPEETILEACGDRPLPKMGIIEQQWESDPIPNDKVAAAAAATVNDLALESIPEGGEIAIGAGSRGINHISKIVRGVTEELKSRGYEPFVFPAMGSHGGATAKGQREKLDALGINEETIGCEIRATMDVIEVGRTPERGVPVVADANAASADAIVPINRIKAHTDFQGEVESGLSKMLVIGMGKQKGAKTAHEWSVNWSLRNMLPEISTQLRKALPVIGGVAIVEDQRDDTAIIEGIPPEGFLRREAELLELSYQIMPTLPFDEFDVLVVDQQGKDISGAGMDTNVTGRMEFGLNEPEPERPNIKRIFIRSLTNPSLGNATAWGCADFIHQDLLAEANLSKTLINCLTASTPRGARVPPAVETDRAGLIASLSTIGMVSPKDVRVARITDTMRLERLYVSETLVEEARERDDLKIVEEPKPIAFEDDAFAAPSPVPRNH